MITDKNPYSRESKSNGRRSSILKRQDTCFIPEGSDGNTECPRTPRRVSFASTATVRYLHISSGDESCVSSSNSSDTSSASSGSLQSLDRDCVFAELPTPLPASCHGESASHQPCVFGKLVCNSMTDSEMGPLKCEAASLEPGMDKTIFYTSMNMSLSDIFVSDMSEASNWEGDNDEISGDSAPVRQQEEQNHTILYTESDQYSCCMDLTSSISQQSESLLQESNTHSYNGERFSPEEPQNKPGLKRRPSFADGGKSESRDDQAFVRMYANSVKENVPDCTIIFGNKDGVEMEFTEHEILPVTTRPYPDEMFSTDITLKPKPKLLDDLFQLVKPKEPNNDAMCSTEGNLTHGVEDMEFTEHEILPITIRSYPDEAKSEPRDGQAFVKTYANSVKENIPDCTIIFGNKGGEEMEFTQHKILPVTVRPYPDEMFSTDITLKPKPKLLDDLFQLVKPKEPNNVAMCSTEGNLKESVEDMEFTENISQVFPRAALSDITTLKVLPAVNQSVPPVVIQVPPPALFNRAPPPPPPVFVSQTLPALVDQELPDTVNRALPCVVGQAKTPVVSQTLLAGVTQVLPTYFTQELQPMPQIDSETVPLISSQKVAPVVSQTVVTVVSQTVTPIVSQELPTFVSRALPPPVVDHTVPLSASQIVPSFSYQTVLPVGHQAVPAITSHIVPLISHQGGLSLASQTVSLVSHQAGPPVVSPAVPPVSYQAVPSISYEAVPPGSYQTVSSVSHQTVAQASHQEAPSVSHQTLAPVSYQTVSPVSHQTVAQVSHQEAPPVSHQRVAPVSHQTVSPVNHQAVPPVSHQSVPPDRDQAWSPVNQAQSPVVDQAESLAVDQAESPVVDDQIESPMSPNVTDTILPILVNHAYIPEGSFLSDLESVNKTEQMLSESVNLQDLYEILGISRLEKAQVKSVPALKLPAATSKEKLIAKTISMSRLCCLKQHLNEIEAAINRHEQECTEKLIQFSDNPPEILAAVQAKEKNVSDLRTKAQAVVNSCRILAQAMWKRYKIDYHVRYSETVERACRAIDLQTNEMVSSTEKALDLAEVVDKCLQTVDLILGQKQELTKQQVLLEESEREVQKLKAHCKHMDDRVVTCTEEIKDGEKSLTSIDITQESVEERLSWMNSFTEWTVLNKSPGTVHFGFLFNTLVLAVDINNHNSCEQISRVNLHSRLAAGSKPWAKLAHHLIVMNVDCKRLQASYTDYHQMHQLLRDVSAIVCDFRQFSMELKRAHLKHSLTIDDYRLKFTVSNRKTRQKISLETTVAPDYHPHSQLVWSVTTLIGSVSSQHVKLSVDQIVNGPNYMTRVLSQTEKVLAAAKR